MRVRLCQLDGSLPNLALMRISAYHKAQGDEVHFHRNAEPDLMEPDYDRVYGGSIFKFSDKKLARFQNAFPDAIVGGTGTFSTLQVEDLCPGPESYDYSIYPSFTGSLGFTQRGCRLSCKFCLAPGSLVITGDGPKPIEEVEVGDLVLTHMGRYRRVAKTMYRYYNGPVVTLRSGALSELFPTTVTANHRIWTRHVSYYSGGQRLTLFNWLEAGEIKPGFPQRARAQYAYPRTKAERPRLEVPGADWASFDRGAPKHAVLDKVEVTEELMLLLGFYLAEGHLSAAGRDPNFPSSVIFSFGHTDTEISYAEAVVAAVCGLGLSATIKPVPTGTRVSVYNTRLARWLLSEFGTGSAAKRVPLWVRLLPERFLRKLLDAWCDGDGWSHVKKGSKTWKITTTSPALVLACREMALKCGYSATVNRHITSDTIEGRKVSTKPAYTAIFHEPAAHQHSVVRDANYVYQLAKPSEVREYAGFVYNLEVEGDNSYCTPAFAISNCVVPTKEGKNRSVNSVYDIWRGDPWPRHLHLLDNDFFGQESWQERSKEIIEGGFKVCFNQGLNVRLITEEGAAELAKMQYRDDQFKTRRIYTAWDNAKDFKIFFRGVDMLEKAGINTKDILAYMLVGFAKGETMEEIEWRFAKMRERGIHPFPMVYDRSRRDLRDFARWAIRGIHHSCSFAEYRTSIRKRDERDQDFFAAEAADAEYPVTMPVTA